MRAAVPMVGFTSLLFQLTLSVAAQAPTAPAAMDGAFTVPIHTAAPGAGGQSSDGVWASGPDYKVSFHDGVAFYPVLGRQAPRNLPLRWRTRSVRLGATELHDGARVTTHHGDWRFEYRYGAVTEAYDVRPEGVEQTFVLKHRPAAGAGDLVVTGSIETDLRADATVGPRSGELRFRDDQGREVVRYGRALAFDAFDRAAPVTTSFDGKEVRLRLSRDWLDQATYPVTVDPLLSTVLLSGAGSTLEAPRIVTRLNKKCVTYSRAVSGSDFDAFARVADDQWTNPAMIFADVTAQWSTSELDCAFASSSDKWIVVMTRTFPTPSARVSYHLHGFSDTSLSASVKDLPVDDWQAARASVGGSDNPFDDRVMVVYEVDPIEPLQPTDQTEIWVAVIDTERAWLLDEWRLDRGSAQYDNERPQISKWRGSDGHWFISYQEIVPGLLVPSWNVVMTKAKATRETGGLHYAASTSVAHELAPQIDGRDGRGAISYVIGTGTGILGREVRAQRFDWPSGAASPTLGRQGTVRRGTALFNGGIAYDNITDSHWTVVTGDTSANVAHADRIGSDARVAEAATLGNGSYPAVAYRTAGNEFDIVFAAGVGLWGRSFDYPTPSLSIYGSRCGTARLNAIGFHQNLPHAGHVGVPIRVTSAPSSVPALLMLGGASGSLDLGFFGMAGCTLHLDPGSIFYTESLDFSGASGEWTLPVPSFVRGSVYAQVIYVSPGSTARGLQVTEGLQIDVQ
ncbi:MAG: hypothetical protein AAF628_25205 [Planctomycetota bacterium]